MIFVLSAYAQYPVINQGRSRIYADSARLAWLQNVITITGACQAIYYSFTYVCNNWWINKDSLLQVFPNPSLTELYILLKNDRKKYDIWIFDSNGDLKISCKNQEEINISELLSGVYLILVKPNNNLYSIIFIKN
jgi:hypothetical protein